VRAPTALLTLIGTLCAAVVLNGCSSSVQPNGKIAGAGSEATATASNGASATSDSSSGNALPADLSLDFTDPQLTGVSEDIYTSAKSFAEAYEAAVSADKFSNQALSSMITVPAAAGVARNVDSDARAGDRWAGTITFSHFQVAILSKATGIGFCESDAEAYPVSIAGDVRKGSSPTGTQAVRAWSLTVAKQQNGSYQITSFSTVAGDVVCL
jgi:hypothetical protein